jgi:hypothetical protein
VNCQFAGDKLMMNSKEAVHEVDGGLQMKVSYQEENGEAD